MGFGWMFVLFLLCAWQYKRLTQPAHLWIFRSLYYLSRSGWSAYSLCHLTHRWAVQPGRTNCQLVEDRQSSHSMHECVMLQLLRAMGTQRHHLAAPLGECSAAAPVCMTA